MADTIYDNLVAMRLQPMHMLWLWFYTPGTYTIDPNAIAFKHLEADSTWNLTPITEKGMYGKLFVAGYTVDIQATVFYNNFADMQSDLNRINHHKLAAYQLELRPYALTGDYAQSAGGHQRFGGMLTLGSESCSCKIEKAEMRPRLTISIHGEYITNTTTDPDAPDFAPNFTQVSGW